MFARAHAALLAQMRTNVCVIRIDQVFRRRFSFILGRFEKRAPLHEIRRPAISADGRDLGTRSEISMQYGRRECPGARLFDYVSLLLAVVARIVVALDIIA